jgi:8-oxo-dGTP pyrophosphatase MutT (NUDIX family)
VTLAERIGRALAKGNDSDLLLLAGDMLPDEFVTAPATAAAVLVAITDRPAPGLILTQRTTTMRRHAGQIAFPGGRVDPEDADAISAALREAEEEIALPRNLVEVVGTADVYSTMTGFVITPVIGIVPPDLDLIPSEAEVADVFEVPLDFVLDPANQRQASLDYQGRERRYYEINWNDRRIWGATAAMIVNLSRRLQWRS